MKILILFALLSAFAVFAVQQAKAQSKQPADTLNLLDMSFDDLMNVKIVSASKKTENLFDAPLSASVLTREEIKNAGPTTIMEALRLIPGLIVRQQSNGNYDIHIRGLDNVPPNSSILSSTNTTTLVMINNRPVYNFLQGGTFWESLPIDLNDVEKIEVIRGPSSTLYGPNAVSGVINIITHKAEKDGVTEKDGMTVAGTLYYGSQQTSIANTSVGYKFNNKVEVGVSGNYQLRGRDVRYLDKATGEWVNSIDDLSADNADESYPHPDKSMIKHGINAFAHVEANEKVQFHVTTGLQDSEVQNIMFESQLTNLSTTTTKSKYIDFQSSAYKLNTQVSYTMGVQAPTLGMAGSKFDYSAFDVTAEYELDIKGILIKPGITFRNAAYDDGAYADIANGEGALDGKRTMRTVGGGIRFDYNTLKERLRLTGGIRMDKFTYPDKWFTSYQAAASYKLNNTNMVRLVYSKAYRSPFIFDTYINFQVLTEVTPGTYSEMTGTGNKDLELLSSNMLETGYRAQIKRNILLDIEAYYTQTRHYSTLVQGSTTQTPENYPVVETTSISPNNIPLMVEQFGTSISLTIAVGKFQLKPFVTFQKTELNDYSPYFSTQTADPSASNNFDPANYNINSGMGSKKDHKFTPHAYGGTYINYRINSKFNINLNTYWFSRQTFYHENNIAYNDGIHGVEHIQRKVIVNARFAYTPIQSLSIFITGKNLLDNASVEYYRGDVPQRTVLAGLTFDFK